MPLYLQKLGKDEDDSSADQLVCSPACDHVTGSSQVEYPILMCFIVLLKCLLLLLTLYKKGFKYGYMVISSYFHPYVTVPVVLYGTAVNISYAL